MLLLSSILFIPSTGAASWLSTYQQRQKHTITGSAGAGTNYPIFLNISSGNGISSGDTCYLNNTCQNFPYDIAFTDDDGITQLDYFIENISSDPIRTWVEVTDNLDTAQDIYIYYNKTGVTTSNSNGANTFNWFYDWTTTYDPANLTQSANAGDRWIHVYNSSAFGVGDNLTIADRSYNGTHTVPITYAETRGSSENISIAQINHANNSFQITTTLSRGYNATGGHYATVSHWYRHAVYDITPGKTFRWYLENATRPSLTDFRSLIMQEVGERYTAPYSQSTIGIGICEILNLDEESGSAPSVDSYFLRHGTKSGGNATSTTPGNYFYSVNNGIENDPAMEITSQSGVNQFAVGFPYVSDVQIDGSQSICTVDLYNSTTGILNKTITQSSEFPNEALSYPFLRTHGGAGATHRYEFRYNATKEALQVYNNRTDNQAEMDLFVFWWAIGKFVSPEPVHSTWEAPEDKPTGTTGNYLEDYEDDAPNSNPTEIWYTFVEGEGGIYGYVVNENNATWTHTFKVDTSSNANNKYNGHYTFTNDTYQQVSIKFRNDAINGYITRLEIMNDTNILAGIRLIDSSSWDVYESGSTTSLGATCAADTWYEIEFNFNWSTNKYEVVIDDINYGWYNHYETDDKISIFRIRDNSDSKRMTIWIDDLHIRGTIGDVVTNDATNVEETTATLNGALDSELTGSYTVRFEYGTTINFGTNTSNQTKSAGNSFSSNIVGLSRGTRYYLRAYAENGTNKLYGTRKTLITKPNPPSNLLVTTTSADNITLTWTKGTGAIHTVVSRNASGSAAPPSSPDAGTRIYNGTGTSYTDTNRLPCVNYSYSVWSWTIDKYSDANQTGYNLTLPEIPTNVDGVITGSNINISWIKGTNADNTLIRKKSGNYPTGVTDGTLVYNSTGTYNTSSIVVNDYYSLWGYNTTYNIYSLQVNLTEGGLRVNCYDENDSSPLTFDIFMTNLLGTQTYNASGCTNTYTVDITDAPNGEDILVLINSSGYNNRQYYVDITIGFWYTLNAYLAEETATNLYILSVEDEFNDPIDAARIRIMKYINASFGWQNVTILETDANGYAPVYLIPGRLYKVIITKTGYQTEISDYRPHITELAHTFRLQLEEAEEPITYRFWDVVDFTATAYGVNGSMRVDYTDSSGKTTDTQFYLFEHYNLTSTLMDTETRTGESTITYWIEGLNLSRIHYINLHLNHTYDFIEDMPIKLTIYPVNGTVTNRSQQSFEGVFVSVLGRSPYNMGWGNLIACGLAIIMLCIFSPFNVGVSIMGAGVSFGAIEVMFLISNPYIIAIIPITIVVGILYILATREPGRHL